MSISIPGKTIVFDYGEVISHTPSATDRDELVALAAVPGEAFWSAYEAGRLDLDRGTTSIRAYWDEIERRTGARWTDAHKHTLWLSDYRSWLSLDEGTVQILEELREAGTRLALLSNAGEDFASYFRYGSLGALFDQVFVSGELRMVKPDAAIYEYVLDQLGITPDQMVFIDNKEINVRGAEALGITGHVFTSADDLRQFLESRAE